MLALRFASFLSSFLVLSAAACGGSASSRSPQGQPGSPSSPGSSGSGNAGPLAPSVTSFDLGASSPCTATAPAHPVCAPGAPCVATIDVAVACTGTPSGTRSVYDGDVLLDDAGGLYVLAPTGNNAAVLKLDPSSAGVVVDPNPGNGSALVRAGGSFDVLNGSYFDDASWAETPVGGGWGGFDRGSDGAARVIVANGQTWMVQWSQDGKVSTRALPGIAQVITASPNGTLALLAFAPLRTVSLDGTTSPLPIGEVDSMPVARVRADGELPYVAALTGVDAVVLVPTASGYVATHAPPPVTPLAPSSCPSPTDANAHCTARSSAFQSVTLTSTSDGAVFYVALWEQVDQDMVAVPSPSDPASYEFAPSTDRSATHLVVGRVPADGSPPSVSLDVPLAQDVPVNYGGVNPEYGGAEPVTVSVDARGTRIALAVPAHPGSPVQVMVLDAPRLP